MSNIQSNDSLRELDAKLLAVIGELRKKFAEIKVENDELKNTEIAELETEKAVLKARIAGLLKQAVEDVMLRMPNSRPESRNWRKTRQILQPRMLGVMLKLLTKQ
jgi:hypothetical protein